jgi:hypothetical protein
MIVLWDRFPDKKWLIEISQSNLGDVGCANGYYLNAVQSLEQTLADRIAIRMVIDIVWQRIRTPWNLTGAN